MSAAATNRSWRAMRYWWRRPHTWELRGDNETDARHETRGVDCDGLAACGPSGHGWRRGGRLELSALRGSKKGLCACVKKPRNQIFIAPRSIVDQPKCWDGNSPTPPRRHTIGWWCLGLAKAMRVECFLGGTVSHGLGKPRGHVAHASRRRCRYDYGPFFYLKLTDPFSLARCATGGRSCGRRWQRSQRERG